MYVCICNAVTDRQILDAAATGAETLYELMQRTGCGNCCGCCQDDAEALLAQSRKPAAGAAAIPVLPVA